MFYFTFIALISIVIYFNELMCVTLLYEFKNASTNVLAKRLSISEQQSTWMSTETSKERLINFLTRSATLNKQGEIC